MKSVLSIWLVLFICFLNTTSCRENTDNTNQNNTINTFADYLGEPIKIDLKGKVIDLNNTPLDSVLVVAGNKSATTDEYGNFTINNVSAHQEFVALEAQRKDYKNTMVTLAPKKDTSAVNIILLKATEPCLFWFCKHNHNLPNTID
ncbi:carboxypeptidase-like regulatory domain-containing protein [Winogradskyella ouciana]|uniref:CarboxypepD_reg-like domain-containing protein n=1 Tax=Winogradskyella ouciana TaxID=2608631 RepID=A0A7K1GHN4_9FLAO|nr:carboxypeptidase-like regulatory domain-containing protein [Winogradskyella ouciana]MTE28134.1 hypothetical protein [Winogradskyella ouciana]